MLLHAPRLDVEERVKRDTRIVANAAAEFAMPVNTFVAVSIDAVHVFSNQCRSPIAASRAIETSHHRELLI